MPLQDTKASLPIEVIALQPANETEVMVDRPLKAEFAMLVSVGLIAIAPVPHEAVGLLKLTHSSTVGAGVGARVGGLEASSSLLFRFRREFELSTFEISDAQIRAKKATEIIKNMIVNIVK